MDIHALDGSLPHPDYNGWAGFLETCEVRDVADGVIYYGAVNCNYLLFPDGTLIRNYGYHGPVLMKEVRRDGVTAVLARCKALGW